MFLQHNTFSYEHSTMFIGNVMDIGKQEQYGFILVGMKYL